MAQLHKVGDIVLIKNKYDPGCDGSNYMYYFLEDMLAEYGGIICTISRVEYHYNLANPNKIPDDGYLYFLEEDNEEWLWASSMFEPEF
jgi:hypothetical protein